MYPVVHFQSLSNTAAEFAKNAEDSTAGSSSEMHSVASALAAAMSARTGVFDENGYVETSE